MHDAMVAEGIRLKFKSLDPVMDERVRRHWAATEAMALARGGISAVARATGLSRTTIRTGISELKERDRSGVIPQPGCVRRAGGGRKPLTQTDPALVQA